MPDTIDPLRTTSGFQVALRQAQLYERLTGVFMGPSAELIVEAMDLKSGDRVLDLACGTGLVARPAWRTVGRGGWLVGADVNPTMLSVARSIEPEIEWLEASADKLPLEPNAFTHVACQQGLQFFPDTAAAMAEVHRVLRPGGRFLATVWATPGHNPYIETQLALLSELEPSVAESARQATPANADNMVRALGVDAGFAEVGVSMLEHIVEVGDLETFFLDQTASTPWAPVLARLSPYDQAGLAADFATHLEHYRNPSGGHRLPFASHLLAATK